MMLETVIINLARNTSLHTCLTKPRDKFLSHKEANIKYAAAKPDSFTPILSLN